MKKTHSFDPENGDYVKYIEDIQRGRIKPPASTKPMLETPIADASSTETPPKKRKVGTPPAVLGALATFLVIAGLGFVSYGIIFESDEFIPIGMFTLFAGFVFSMNLRK